MSRQRRTKQKLIDDVTQVLNAPLHPLTQRAVVKNAAWAWTADSGKYKGCTLWTKAAIERFENAQPRRKRQGLNHEHVVPIQEFFKMLLQLPRPVHSHSVGDLFERLMRGVVVTTEEHDKLNEKYKNCMPQDFCSQSSDPLMRYQRCGIQVISIEWSTGCQRKIVTDWRNAP